MAAVAPAWRDRQLSSGPARRHVRRGDEVRLRDPGRARKLGILKAGEFEGSYKRFAAAFARSDARARPGAIVFLGDSIMRDLDTSSIARHTLNLAIPTDTTAGVLKRSQTYRSLATARGVVIGVGVNDLVWRPIPEALRNYRSILELVPQATPVLALAVLACRRAGGPPAQRRCRQAQRRHCQSVRGPAGMPLRRCQPSAGRGRRQSAAERP